MSAPWTEADLDAIEARSATSDPMVADPRLIAWLREERARAVQAEAELASATAALA